MGSEVNRAYRTLRECTSTGSVSYGIVQPGKHVEDGVPIVRVNNINDGTLDLADPLKVDPTIDEKHRKTRLEGGEVLLSLVGTTGQCVVAGPELKGWNVARAIAVIKPAEGIDADWLTICLKSPETQHYLDSRANTTVQKTLNLSDVREIPILTVPDDEERYILEWWNTLNDKIDLNRRMNATLEGMAQALFKSWFVDFDPVIDNALAAGNPIPDELAPRAEVRKKAVESKEPSLSAEASAKAGFPATFQFTEELGWIPEGWESKTSGELFDVRDGTHDSPKKSETGKFLITSRHITGSTIDYSNAYRISEADFEEVSKRSEVDSYDILLTMIGTVGVPFIVLEEKINFAIKNVGLFKTGSDKTLALFFFTYLKIDFMKNYMESRLAGTTQKYLTLKILRTLPVVAPTGPAFEYFGSQAKPLYEQIHRNNEINRTLEKLRDTLLPMLVSGELQIGDTETLVEEVVA